MSFRDEALAANADYAAGVAERDRAASPSRRVAVVACMDARLRPEDALGLSLGEAHVIRNAGGRVTDDVVRSLMLSSAVLGTREAVVIHHTDCGLLGVTNDGLRERVAEITGQNVQTDFLPFDDAEGAVISDMRAIEGDTRLAFDAVTGLIYDVRTGRLREVVTG